MTRVYSNPEPMDPAQGHTRVLIVGAGVYPNAHVPKPMRPALKELSGVGPSVRTFLTKLLTQWKDHLGAPLHSVDLLLSDPAQATGSTWGALGTAGEIADAAPIAPPTLGNLRVAVNDWLDGSSTQDHLMFVCCGHGFWKS